MRLTDLKTKIWSSLVRAPHDSASRFMRIEEQGDRPSNANCTELRNITQERHTMDASNNERDKRLGIEMTITQTSRAEVQTSIRGWYAQGWRFGASNCACSVITVFFINFFVSCWGSAHRNTGLEEIFEEECHKGSYYLVSKQQTQEISTNRKLNVVSKMNTYLHLAINLLSTILLSSSNYCMQCLSAPTRKEVDAAHAKGVWLDIGVPSIRNLKHIDRTRVLLWGLLGLSSLPLHLL
jgi:hypothetical protein